MAELSGQTFCAPTSIAGLDMPLFYFDIHDKNGRHRDEVGDDLEDVSQARDQAHALLPEIARWQFLDGGYQMITCDVRNACGETIYRSELVFRGTMLDGSPRHSE